MQWSLTSPSRSPRDSRNKYEVDHETGRLRLDRYLYTPMGYPADYGFIEDTLGEDGDPLDAMVLLPESVHPGVIAEARPVAMFKMVDDAGGDDKVPLRSGRGQSVGSHPGPRRRLDLRTGRHQALLRALQGSGAGQVRGSRRLGGTRRRRGGGAALAGAVQDHRALNRPEFARA